MGGFKRLEEIEVWKRGCRLAVDIYKLTNVKELEHDWSLKEQIRRSGLSIPSNIAEGYERDSDAEFKRFLLIAKGSAGELRTQLYILKAMNLLPQANIDSYLIECTEISSMLQSLIIHLKASIQKK